MQNIKQIQLIITGLNKEKEQILFEVVKLNTFIQKKSEGIKKMLQYQQEYTDGKNLTMTRVVPSLHKNLTSFSKKLQDIVTYEEREVRNLSNMRAAKLNKVVVLDQKVKLMNKFVQQIKSDKVIKLDNIEQSAMDDMASIKRSRGDK